MAAAPQPLDDPLLTPSEDRFVMLPIKYDALWTLYRQQVAAFWTVDEIDMGRDPRDWEAMTPDERHFISRVLAFFAAADGIVNENLLQRFYNDVQAPEARAFYSFQAAMESIHQHAYAMMLEMLVRDPEELRKLCEATRTVPAIGSKARWAQRWTEGTGDGKGASFAERLVAFACVENIHFSASFCALFWLKKRGIMPGLTFANELISRDEGLHATFACTLHGLLRDKASPERIREIVTGAVDTELEFVKDALPHAVLGMNADLMTDYVKFCADYLLVQLGCDKAYGVKNPLDFMEMISMEASTNFFERRVSEYKRAPAREALTFDDQDF